MRVCIFTTAHALDDVRVEEKIGCTFLAQGWQVAWLGPERRSYAPGCARDGGYQHRLFPPKPGKLGRLLAHRQAYRLGRSLEPTDWFYCPDPDAAVVALRLRRQHGGRVLFDIHELFHGRAMGHWGAGLTNGAVSGIIRGCLRQTCAACDVVMAVNESLLKEYAPGQPRRFIARNCAPRWFAQGPAAQVCRPGRGEFVLMHGKAALSRGTRTLLEAVGLAQRQVGGFRVVMFAEAGARGTAEAAGLTTFARQVGAGEALDLRPAVAPETMPALLAECDVGLIMYGRQLGKFSLPNRLFEYMAAGLPVLAPNYAEEIVPVLKAEECGLTVDCEEPRAVAEALLDLRRQPEACRRMGQRAREAFLARHNWEAEIQPVLDCLNSGALPSPPRLTESRCAV